MMLVACLPASSIARNSHAASVGGAIRPDLTSNSNGAHILVVEERDNAVEVLMLIPLARSSGSWTSLLHCPPLVSRIALRVIIWQL
jgi:hypothetical protein